MSILRDKKFNCDLIDQSEDYGLMSLQGPNSRDILNAVFANNENSQNSEIHLDNEQFPFSTQRIVTLDGVGVRVLRVSFVGEMGWELHVPKDKCFKIYHHIMEAGKKFGLVNAGYRAIDSLSIEKGENY